MQNYLGGLRRRPALGTKTSPLPCRNTLNSAKEIAYVNDHPRERSRRKLLSYSKHILECPDRTTSPLIYSMEKRQCSVRWGVHDLTSLSHWCSLRDVNGMMTCINKKAPAVVACSLLPGCKQGHPSHTDYVQWQEKKWVINIDRITQHWMGFCDKTFELSDIKDQII